MQVFFGSKRVCLALYFSPLLCIFFFAKDIPSTTSSLQAITLKPIEVDTSFCTKEISDNSSHCGIPAVYARLAGFRIVKGGEANPFSFPYIVLVFDLKREHPHNGYKCGGSIIAERLVLTAAHCFDEADSVNRYVVISGIHNMKDGNGKELSYELDDIIRHDQFNKNFQTEYDIALLKTKYKMRMSCFSRKVCLPYNKPVEKGLCITAGWGKIGETEGTSPVLRQLTMPLLNDANKCSKMLKTFRTDMYPGMMCGGFESGSSDSCQGDSGGPVFCYYKKRYYLKGIVSFGDGCGRVDRLGVYSNVTYFMPWILQKAAELGEPLPVTSDIGL